jgi:hypothetical protein
MERVPPKELIANIRLAALRKYRQCVLRSLIQAFQVVADL